MSYRNPQTIRFAVGSAETPHSFIWRMWVNHNDVYLGARDMLRAFKVSLHRSAIWRIAWVQDLKRSDADADRVLLRWRRPEVVRPGWTLCFAILVSSIQPVRAFNPKAEPDKRILWLPLPATGRKLVFMVFVSSPGLTEEDLRALLQPNDVVVGRLREDNHETAWLVACELDLTALENSKVREVMANTIIHVKPDSPENSVHASRALLVVSDDVIGAANPPTVFDVPLGRENVQFDG